MGSRVSSPTFVGRVEELRALEAAWVRAANAEPAVVLLGGEAGVGKTRLVAELEGRCANDDVRVLGGGCVPVGSGALPYSPIVQALRALLADLGADRLRELAGPAWPELARLLPALGDPDGTGGTGPPEQYVQARLFEVLLGLLGRLGEQAPLVLVVEDVHWADHSTRDLLAFLVRNLRRERILLVVTYRSDESGQARLGPYLAELDRVGRVERIDLPRFQRSEVVAQLTGILGAAPASHLVDAVFARSEGNPFFTEELLEAARAGSDELPATLRDLLRGRVLGLPEPTRQVLRVAAVAGRQVPHRLLATVSALDDHELAAALRPAVDRQLLVTPSGEDGYQFRHALLQEVLYASLLPGERSGLHAGYARALTQQPELADGSPAVAAAELAAHWDAAGDPAQALPAAVQAGLAAERAHAVPEAYRHYDRALRLWTRTPQAAALAPLDRVTLLERAAQTAHLVDVGPRAVQLLRAALDAIDQQRDPIRAGLLQEQLGRNLWAVGDKAALSSYEQAVRLVSAEPPSAERAWILAGYAQLLFLLHRYADSRRVAEEGLTAARQAKARREEGRALACLGGALVALGDYGGFTLLRDAWRIVEEQADVDGLGWACNVLASSNEWAGRLKEALAATLEGAEASRRLGAPAWHDTLLSFAGYFEFLLGRWEEADRHLRAVLEYDRPSVPKGVYTRWDLARIHIARGDFAAARHWLDEARSLAATAGPAQFDAQFAAPFAIAQAELALWEGNDEEAFEAAAQGLSAMTRLGDEAGRPSLFAIALAAAANKAELAHVHRAASKIEAAQRDGDQLLARLETLVRGPVPTRPEMAAVLQQCRAEHARLHGRPDPAAWAAAAAGWEALGQPYPVAYSGWREAEMLLATRAPRAHAERALQAAHQVAVRLGAAPLRHELERLAERGRLRLEAPAAPAMTEAPMISIAASFGLTPREAEVLALVATGRTNRQIGQQLFITPKTAGVHVSRILAKLGVTGRGEAAAVAHRLGLDKQ